MEERNSRIRDIIIRNIIIALPVAVIGGLIVEYLAGEGRFAPRQTPETSNVTNPPALAVTEKLTNPLQTHTNPTFPQVQQPVTSANPPISSPTSTQAPAISTFEVYANLSWQNTSIQIKSGDRLRIIWDGKSKWRGVNYGDFSDPLGGFNDPYSNYICTPLMPADQAGWNALVSKIGENGTPSNPFKSIPLGEGSLYLAMNDCDKQRNDNEGSVIVTIEIQP